MNRELIILVEKSKYDNNALLDIINLFEPKVKGSLYQTQPLYREDLRQELMIKLIKSIKKFDVQSVPGFWDMKDYYSGNE